MAEVAAHTGDARPVSPIRTNRRRDSALFYAGAGLLVVLALALRLRDIGGESLWMDEGYTLLFSGLSLPRLILVGGAHEHPPLYYLVVHVLIGSLHTYLVIRYVSAVAGTLSVAALALLGRRLFGSLAGLCAAALAAVSPFHLWYSQDGRAYELAGLWVVLSYLFLTSALDNRNARWWLLYTLASVLALYTEYTTLLVLLPQAVWLRRAEIAGLRQRMIGSWIACAVLFAPWVGVVTLDAASIATHYWIPPPAWSDVRGTVLQFLGMQTTCPQTPCVPRVAALPLLTGHADMVAALTIIAVCLTALWSWRKRGSDTLVAALWVITPFAVILALAVVRPLYLDRVFLDGTFGVYLLLGAGLAVAVRHARSVPLALPAVIVVTASIVTLGIVYAFPSNPDWKSPARDLASAYRPGQAVVFVPGVLQPLVHAYLPRSWKPTRESVVWYRTYLDVPGWTQKYAYATDADLRDMQLTEAASGMRQVWLVTQDYAGISDTRRWFIEHGYEPLISEIYLDDTRLELWDQEGPNALGPATLPAGSARRSWTLSPGTTYSGGTLVERGHTQAVRTFPVTPGRAYSANVEYRAVDPASPNVSIRLFDRRGRNVSVLRDRFGRVLDSFPRTEWYDLPAAGVWLSQPFGFVAPPGAVRAQITLRNGWGTVRWRHIAVYGER